MKRIITKTVASLLVIVLTVLALFSCGGQQNGDNNKNSTGDSRDNVYYYSVKTLYSYDDVMDALSIVRKRIDVKPTYTVKDMGDDYTIFYQFWVGHSWTAYPIDYDTYFSTKSDGYFVTYIFFENQSCDDSNHSDLHGRTSLVAYKEDTDYEKLIKYINGHPCVWVRRDVDYFSEIKSRSNLKYQPVSSFEDYYEYIISNWGNTILTLWSCIELDDTFFDKFFDSLVTTSVAE